MANNKKTALGIGSAIAAAAAAVAGAYYLYGKKGPQRRHKLKASVASAKAEIAKQMHKLGKVDKKTYLSILSNIAASYQAFKDFDRRETDALVKELKNHWGVVRDDVQKAASSLKSRARRVVKKARTSAKRKSNSR